MSDSYCFSSIEAIEKRGGLRFRSFIHQGSGALTDRRCAFVLELRQRKRTIAVGGELREDFTQYLELPSREARKEHVVELPLDGSHLVKAAFAHRGERQSDATRVVPISFSQHQARTTQFTGLGRNKSP